jgi:hypothetical protein
MTTDPSRMVAARMAPILAQGRARPSRAPVRPVGHAPMGQKVMTVLRR